MANIETYLKRLFLLLIVFYYMYPQALGVFGRSFIFLSGIVGLGLYLMHRLPFKEIIYVALAFGGIFLATFLSSLASGNADDYILSGYMRSQAAWFFSAYLIIFFLYQFHENPTIQTVVFYLIGVLTLQAICTIFITYVPSVASVLQSLELSVAGWQESREESVDQRLIGYGIGYYGAGVMFGYGLIFIVYAMAKSRIKKKREMFLLAILYVLIFYIGTFTARTVVIGAAISIFLMAIYYIKDYKQVKRRSIQFLIYFLILAIIGYSIMYAYLPTMTDWAFEVFINLAEGKVETDSSNGILVMIQDVPDDLKLLLFGRTKLEFFGNDVGFIRMIYHSGIIGMFAFYLVSVVLVYLCRSKDQSTNILLIILVIYEWAINVKGIADFHNLFFLFFFFLMFHKYYKYRPKVRALSLRQKKIKQLNY